MKLNKFVKFPLVLGVVGSICAGALGVVYEITNPIIQDRINQEANAAVMELIPEMDSAKDLTKTIDGELLKKYKVSSVKEVVVDDAVYAYCYQIIAAGRNGDISMLVAIAAEEDKIIDMKIINQSETADYWNLLVDAGILDTDFEDLGFDELSSVADQKVGATLSLAGVCSGIDSAISFHKQAIKGEVSDGINLSGGEREKFGLEEGQTMVDKTEHFLTNLKAATSANKYESIVEELKLINFLEIVDASNNVLNYAYVVEQSYSCELEHGSRGTQKYKIALMFDANWANSKLLVISSSDSLSSVDLPSLFDMPWLEEFKGHTAVELGELMANSGIDKVAGATFTTNTVIAHVASITDAHIRAFGD